jgi:hypothetical protein
MTPSEGLLQNDINEGLRMTNYTLSPGGRELEVRGISRTYALTPALSRQGRGRKKNAIIANVPDWYVSLTRGYNMTNVGNLNIRG